MNRYMRMVGALETCETFSRTPAKMRSPVATATIVDRAILVVEIEEM